jgi:hypothetical protein
MPQPDFITTNPAVDEFNRANAVATQQQNADLEQQGKQTANAQAALTLKTTAAEAPSKLKMLNAQADTAATTAQYAPAEARAKIAEMNTRTAQVHVENFYKSLDLLNSGDIDGAQAFAAKNGETLPPEVVQNAQVRAAVSQIAAKAKEIYPNRPKDQMAYMHSYISTMAAQQAQGKPINDPTAPYTVPNAPEPPEMGGIKTGETQQIIQSIMAANPGMSYEQAVAAAHGKADEGELRRETLALSAAKADTNYAADPAATLAKWRTSYGLAPMPGAPGAAPARPPSVPQGSAYSPSRRMWRDPQGNLYDGNGQPAQAAPGPQAAAPAAPAVPTSQ